VDAVARVNPVPGQSAAERLITLVIPFHNEEESLRELLDLVTAAMDSTRRRFEVLMVDDASTDGGRAVVEAYLPRDPRFRLLIQGQRGGQTEAFRRAFAEAKGDVIIRMDADLQDDPRDLPQFLAQLDDGADLVMGLRENRKHSRLLRIATRVYDLLIAVLFDTNLHSNSGSFVAFRAQHVKDIRFRPNDHRYLPLIAIRRGASDVREVIVRHHLRKYGRPKYKVIHKILFGVPEVLMFLLRCQRGYYDRSAR
jgi:glycosyltransferase involved in cell wall biosynthesis